MRLPRSTYLILPAALSLAFAPVPPYRPRPDLRKMQGAWAVAVRTINGSDHPAYRQDLTVEIAGDRIRFVVKGELRTEWAISLDDKKAPKVFDMRLQEGRGTIGAGKGPHDDYLGIYRLDGDTLRLSHVVGRNGQPRPTDFEGKRRGESTFLLKRIKP